MTPIKPNLPIVPPYFIFYGIIDMDNSVVVGYKPLTVTVMASDVLNP